MPESTYLLYSVGEVAVAGAMALSPQMCEHGMRPAWTGYVAVQDVDAAATKIQSLGGAVYRPAEDIPGVGRFAVVGDPQGAAFNLFKAEPGSTPPPEAPMGTPGYCGWRELQAADGQSAFDFYAAMFGWDKDMAVEMGPGFGVYQTFRARGAGQAMGGMMTKGAELPVPMWIYYFGVEAAQAGSDRVKASGGQALMAPHEVPGGSWIVPCLDPQGAVFALLAPKL